MNKNAMLSGRGWDRIAAAAGRAASGNWALKCARPALAPRFRVGRDRGQPALLAEGNGREDCAGYVARPVILAGGKTYRFRVRFRAGPGINPQWHLLFGVYAGKPFTPGAFNAGIFHFRRHPGGEVTGEECFLAPGRGARPAELRVHFRQAARGRAWIRELTLEECEPVAPRWVKVACVAGRENLRAYGRILDAAGQAGADLVLLPEMMRGGVRESRRGASARLLARKARQHGMYVAGGILLEAAPAERVFNVCLLYDRRGRLAGQYAKQHLFSPELWQAGISPGTDVPVFKTDFGRLGVMICYDSWFTDVAELLALKGAELILFPNVDYDRRLMPARAADNGVWVVASSSRSAGGIWEPTGADITRPGAGGPRGPHGKPLFRGVRRGRLGKLGWLMAALDLSRVVSPHNWGGPLLSAPGGRRNRREQRRLLYAQLQREAERWWEEE